MERYIGRICPKCSTRMNGDSTIKGFKEEKERQGKRYGRLPCNPCMIDFLGGEEKVKLMRQQTILKEMGI